MTIEDVAPQEPSGTTNPGIRWNAGAQEEIAVIAYEIWLQRGCPIGSPDKDWLRAEIEFKSRRVPVAASAAA